MSLLVGNISTLSHLLIYSKVMSPLLQAFNFSNLLIYP